MAKKQRCEIEFVRNGNPEAYCFEASIPEPLLCDMLMSEFAPLGLALHEKRRLSLKDRENLCRFRKVSATDLTRHAYKFLKTLNKLSPGSQVVVNASDVAAYVCLTAIYSGDMPEHVEVSFVLTNVPVKLFPEDLVVASIPDNVALNLVAEESSWLSQFQSVCELPKHMSPKAKRLRYAA